MPENYFDKFPVISYNNNTVRDITRRTVLLESLYKSKTIENDVNNFFSYNVDPGERPDNIASYYYKDSFMSWIFYLTNNVIDPYHDWYMDSSTFENFIEKKYGSLYLATTKIKTYQNNWYKQTAPVTVSYYDSLPGSDKKYFEPFKKDETDFSSDLYYTRRRVDWTLTTNKISKYATANGSGFTTDEVVKIYFNGVESGKGQVTFANTSTLQLQHLDGTTTQTSVPANSFVYGTESLTNTIITEATLLANNIPLGEEIYWDPLTYYEYENDINERNKTIRILKDSMTGKVTKDLKNLLNG
jgi:hypothetical protein